jgi:acid phosphatase family membrane protein YuiD
MIGAPLLLTIAIQLLVQLYKALFYSLRHRELQLWRLVAAGGMPSAHSAFVVALVVSVGLHDGLDSSAFAVAVVLASIVIFDTIRVRGTVERQSKMLIRLQQAVPESVVDGDPATSLREVGHSLAEIAIGALVGGVLAAGGYLTFIR